LVATSPEADLDSHGPFKRRRHVPRHAACPRSRQSTEDPRQLCCGHGAARHGIQRSDSVAARATQNGLRELLQKYCEGN